MRFTDMIFIPAPSLQSVLDSADLTSGSRGNSLHRQHATAAIPPINHVAAAFTQNKRYRAKPRRIADVVNPNGRSVYQTDAVFIAY
ncbi:hypothetical protein [Bradyrhizobium sp. CER78]|uniref:hypothetical protein n=1 Tax=Bradyrhizobium sp. CER78 TaxID=3039162 RepID=UPI002449A815|nr:hypothetical protein [Bradyrhizobium sp. CER78]MDH2383810.1 hypothetical protein [Bradyrhizobium sp. CER78]